MTADERIEDLVSRFGQTISDLPKPTKEKYAYTCETRLTAQDRAFKYGDFDQQEKNIFLYLACLADYICHLADVIDRMEVALETALRLMDCEHCHWYDSGTYRDNCANCLEYSHFCVADHCLIEPTISTCTYED